MPNRFDPLPNGLALLAFGAAMAMVTFLSLPEADVTFARSQGTALAALLVAAPAMLIYAGGKGAPGVWWRAFWTAGLLTYLAHFWWAVFRTYQGDFAGVVAHQGLAGVSNYLVTAVWIADVIVAWLPRAIPHAAVLRGLAWTWVTVSFLTASVVFRTGTVQLAGLLLAAGIILALLLRLIDFRPAHPAPAASGAPGTAGLG